MNILPREQRDACPQCGARLKFALSPNGKEAKLKEGDFCVCYHCAGIVRCGEGMKLRTTDEDELAAVDAETYLAITRAQNALLAYNSQRLSAR